MKRKAVKKQVAKEARTLKAQKPAKAMPAAALAIKILSVVLVAILVIALTRYIMGKMPARGFWTLAIILGVIAFLVLPWMRKKFTPESE